MRDEKRIFPFMNEIATLWQTYFPDWRFGQLMSVFENWANWATADTSTLDLFYVEEDRFLELFKEFCEAVGHKG